MAVFRKLFVVAVTGAASASAFSMSPAGIPSTASNTAPLRAASGAAPRSARAASLSLEMARVPFIAGNWKMNPTSVSEALTLAKAIADGKGSSKAQVAICVPHPYLDACGPIFSAGGVELGAQGCYFEQKGAFTGATSTSMIKSVGAQHVLVGHSERRVVFKQSDETINNNLLKILEEGLKPILCIGESKEEYDQGLNTQICAMQLAKGLKGVTKAQMADVTVAYEPVWAIGTGLVCDAPIAQDVHKFIRGWLAKMYDEPTADAVRIQYGGSVTPESVDELMGMPDIDGCLVGGASLDPVKFTRIMNFQ
eukprot:CAMPEP_0173120930 /NCGR_PEP_ID=MMETSP1102-20130122/52898_1 /TAXON_ID=49646 /ORGANISM="Geminigera sp., Strain Caron Lab Isolate" /LENGTH=308 /DNA_ID=CAMNT_0014027269 /DNA_START=15 /DNA_END=941 /DNA_ORIENTATION=-